MTSALILAGGRGSRMGGMDKGWVELDGQPLIKRSITAISPLAQHILISANRNLDDYRALGYPVVSDSIGDYAGPLAGIAAGLAACRDAELLVIPCDAAQLPDQLLPRLRAARARHNAPLAMAHDGQRAQPLYALISTSLSTALHDYLANGHRKVQRWFHEQQAAIADFSDHRDQFHNLNTRTDLDRYKATTGSLTP